MAVVEQIPRNVSTAAAGATVFPYDFKILAKGDLLVQVNGVTKTVDVDYTVSGVGLDAGGDITFSTPFVGGEIVMRKREMKFSRTNDFQSLGDLRSPTLNNDQDAPILMLQQLNEAALRSIRLPLDSTASTQLPPLTPLAPLVVTADGSGFEMGSTTLTGDMLLRGNLADTASGKGSELVGFKQSGAGAVARTLQEKSRERLSLLDFAGVDVTGVTDSTAALVAAYAEAKARRCNLYLPAGTIKISSTLTWDGDVSVIGEGGATNYGCTLITWAGAAGGKMIDVVGRHYGLRFDRIALEGSNTAGTGFQFDRLQNCQIGTLAVFRTTVDGYLIKPNEAYANDNFMFNDISALFCDTFAGNGLRLDSFTNTSNVCHNTFHTLGLTIRNGVGKKALVLGDSDNNSFLNCYSAIIASDANSYGAEFLAAARSNYFFHFQGSIIARAGSKNAIFGFDRENGQPQPVVEATAQLFWTEFGNNASNWNLTVPFAKLSARLVGNVDVAAAGPDASFTDIFHPATGGRIRIGYSNVGAANVGGAMRLYVTKDGTAMTLPAIQFENDSIVQMRIGGKAHTYAPSAPSGGTWGAGDIAYNTAPTAGGNVGWVCVSAGTPGTWKPFGTIAA